MAGFMDANTQYLLRTNLWSRHIKELLLDELNAMKFVRILSDFPDGQTINIPSIGEAETADFTEGQAIKYNSMDRSRDLCPFKTRLFAGNSLEPQVLICENLWDWTISRKGKYVCNRSRIRLVCWNVRR